MLRCVDCSTGAAANVQTVRALPVFSLAYADGHVAQPNAYGYKPKPDAHHYLAQSDADRAGLLCASRGSLWSLRLQWHPYE